MKSLAPIILFVYNRPNHTKRTIEALSANYLAEKSELFIYSDAPKNESEQENVEAVRNYIKMVNGFKKVKIIERTQNFGLVKSITEGVTELINIYGKIIVLEDDLLTHPQFLDFMNESLEFYKDVENVYSITGYSHLKQSRFNELNHLEFIKLTSTWSWATWKGKWEIFHQGDEDSSRLDTDSHLRRNFNYDNSYNYYQMLKDRQTNKVKSWGIIWYWNVFKKGGLTLFPTQTLIDQIGFDGTGQNSKNHIISLKRIQEHDFKFIYPNQIEEFIKLRKKVANILRYRKLSLILQIVKSKFMRTLK
jgi:hypothetical protein